MDGHHRGWWEVEFRRETAARVDVRLDPFSWSHPDIHATVNLKVGDYELVQPWVLQCTRYEFDAVIPKGETIVEAWADGGPTGRRSALYVDVSRKQTA